LIARVGGDEFVALAHGDDEAAQILMKRLHERAEQRSDEDGLPFRISYSVGFAVLHPDSELSLDEALARADGFMYEQKRLKKRRRVAHEAAAREANAPRSPS